MSYGNNNFHINIIIKLELNGLRKAKKGYTCTYFYKFAITIS